MSKGKHRTQLEWQALIEEQANSGLNGLEFCRQRGLFAKTFYRQRKRLRQGSSQLTGAFIQVQRSLTPAVPASSSRIILDYQDCRLQLEDCSPSWVAELMKALP